MHLKQLKLNSIEAARLKEESERMEINQSELIKRLIRDYLPYSQYEKERGLVRPTPIHGSGPFRFEE
jgi:hypothetical protein